MKKFLALILSVMMVASLAACGGSSTPKETAAPAAETEAAESAAEGGEEAAPAAATDLKIGVILVGDETAHETREVLAHLVIGNPQRKPFVHLVVIGYCEIPRLVEHAGDGELAEV